jgi:transcriptional regulator with XRE-family HTH domain
MWYNMGAMRKTGMRRDEMQDLRQILSQRLRDARRSRSYTRFDLARKAGIRENYIILYENGRRLPNLKNLQRIADALEVSADYLLGLEGASEAHDSAPSKGGEQHADH